MLMLSRFIQFALLLLLETLCLYGHAQQLVQSPKDLPLLCARDNQFIGKPLIVLLNEIKPPIRMVYADEGGDGRAPRFSFFFTSMKVYEK